MKLCEDCVHGDVNKFGTPLCNHPLYDRPRRAEDVREDQQACGPDGNWFRHHETGESEYPPDVLEPSDEP